MLSCGRKTAHTHTHSLTFAHRGACIRGTHRHTHTHTHAHTLQGDFQPCFHVGGRPHTRTHTHSHSRTEVLAFVAHTDTHTHTHTHTHFKVIFNLAFMWEEDRVSLLPEATPREMDECPDYARCGMCFFQVRVPKEP